MTLLYLIRHARSTWNAQGRWQGQADPPLDDLGREQAQVLARFLRSQPFAVIYSSPQSRARATAEAVAHEQNLTVTLDDRLRERHVGEWAGLSGEEVRVRYPQSQHNWWVDGAPGGESQVQLMARASAVYQAVVNAHPNTTLAVVSHGGTLNAVLYHALGIDPHRSIAFRFGNTAIARLMIHGDNVRVLTLGDEHHLPDYLRH